MAVSRAFVHFSRCDQFTSTVSVELVIERQMNDPRYAEWHYGEGSQPLVKKGDAAMQKVIERLRASKEDAPRCDVENRL